MTAVRVVDAARPRDVLAALREAYAGGPAVAVRDARASRLAAQQTSDAAAVPAGTALLITTSGSTGEPKTVVLSTAALQASSEATHQRLGGTGQWLLALPLTYIAGLSVLTRSIAAGVDPALMLPGPFDAELFLQAAEEMTTERRYTALVPVQLQRVLDFIDYKPELQKVAQRFNAVLIGGQALEPELRARAERAGLHIIETYGSSETSGGCVYDGVPLNGVTVALDESTSEVLISGATLADGYLDMPDLTSTRFVGDDGARWYRTGDAGVLQNDRLLITGRLDRTVISGGLKISLDAAERVIAHIPGVLESAAVHIPDSEWTSRAALVIVADGELLGSPLQRDALEAALYEAVVSGLGRVAAPKVIVFVEELPLTTSGKPDYVAMATLATEAAASSTPAG